MSGIDNGGGACVASVDPFPLMVGEVYKCLFTSKTILLVTPVRSKLENAGWVASFEKGATTERSLSRVSNNSVLNAFRSH